MAKDIKVVIGANFGDEGKGLATDFLVNQVFTKTYKMPIVVLTNGGAQRGHTVVTPNGIHHTFNHFGSGALFGAPTYISKYFIVNPMVFIKEGINNKVYLNQNCIITTPFDMIANQLIEENRGDDRHGSCGMGIWETILRNGVKVLQFIVMTDKEKKEYLTALRDIYFFNRISSKGIKVSLKWYEIICSDKLIDNYIFDFNEMIKRSTLVHDDNQVFDNFDSIIFENGQGLLLDQDIKGYGKNTTPSNTGLKVPSEMIASINGEKSVEAYYVTRTYLTRHGAGRFDSECSINVLGNVKTDNTNKVNDFQGGLRYGRLLEDELIDRINNDFNKYANRDYKARMFITHTDDIPIDQFKKLKTFKGYKSFGVTRNFVTQI